MLKPRKFNEVQSGKKSSKDNDTTTDNPLGSVFINSQGSEHSCSSESNSSDSSSESEDNRRSKRSRKSSKTKTTCDCKKNYRKLQSQIDLFQRNNDIKLNYMESLLQNLLKTSSAPSTSIVSSSNVVSKSESSMTKPLQSPQPIIPLVIKRPRTILEDFPQDYDAEADEIFNFDVPQFPIIGDIENNLKHVI